MGQSKRVTSLGVLALCLLAWTWPARAQTTTGTTAAICDRFEKRINKHLEAKRHLDAILAATEYERALLLRYPRPTFKRGKFRCVAHRLTFDCRALADWRDGPVTDKKLLEFLRSMTLDRLLVLQGDRKGEALVLTSYDVQRLHRRLGDRKESSTEKMLQTFARLLPDLFGTVQKQEFDTMAGRRVLVLKIKPTDPKQDVQVAGFTHDGQIYLWLLLGASKDRADNEKRLAAALAAVKLAKGNEKATAVRSQFKDPGDIGQLLACVRGLAKLGEYREAALELSSLRSQIAQLMPRPTSDGKVARSSSYGLIVKNPDPEQWKLSVKQQGVMPSISLDNTSSLQPSGIGINVINPLLAYGPPALAYMGPDAKLEDRKEALRAGGRGAILNTCKEIDSERFRKFKGHTAYECVGSTKVPGTKVKVVIIDRPTGFVMVFLLGTAEKIREYEKVVARGLQFKAAK
jgi:hypothetical protein